MQRRTRPSLAGLTAILAALALGRRPELVAEHQEAPATRAPACTVCHPGSLKSLRRGPHAPLVQRDGEDRGCLACHVTGISHQQNPRCSAHSAGSGRNRCASCHEGMAVDEAGAALASHPTKEQAREARTAAPITPLPGSGAAGAERESFGFEGLVRAGWRFVDVAGDERAFDHDWGIDGGLRLAELSARATRGGRTLADGELRGFDDRETAARLATGKGLSESAGAEGSFRRNLYVYDAEGDFHTLSNTREWTRAELWLAGSGGDARFGVDWERLDLDGRTLASRIGNANQSPLVPVTGVPADRRLTSDLFRASYEDRAAWGSWSFELGWEEARSRDELRYSRPSPVNPGFTESEASSSRSSERGPEGTLRLVAGDEDGFLGQVVLFGSQLDVRYVEDGLLTAFDTSSFTTDELGIGSGDRRRLAATLRASQAVWSGARVALDAEIADLKDDVRFTLFETVTRTSPPIVVRTQADLDLLTRVRDHRLRLGIEQVLPGGVDLEAAWRYFEQYLLLPDLEAGDSDFRSGTVFTNGPDLAASWRPSASWRLQARWSLATTDSRTPTETQPEIGQLASGKLRHKFAAGDAWAEVFAKWRHGENDVSSTENDYQSYGATLQVPPWSDARLVARGAWTRIRSRTLTNFYFAPSITPIPTFVTFRGESVLVDLELDTVLAGPLRSLTVAGLQATNGSLDSTLVRVDQELTYRWTDAFTLGVRLTLLDFDEDRGGNEDDYDARIGFVFGELRL